MATMIYQVYASGIEKNIPEVEEAVMLEEENQVTTLRVGDKILKVSGSGASHGLFNMFSYPLVQGTAIALWHL